MHNRFQLLIRDSKQMMGFNQLEGFVGHGTVDGDSRPHVPDGMVQSLLGCHFTKIRKRGVAERATGGGEQD